MLQLFAASLLLVLTLQVSGQRPSDVLATSKVGTIRVSDLTPETAAAIADAPTKRIALRESLFDQFLFDRLLSAEAKLLKTTPAKLQSIVISKVADPAPAKVRAVFEANRDRLGDTTFEQAQRQIIAFLRSGEEQTALDKFAARLRVKYKFAAGKSVNAIGLKPTESIATVNGKAVLAQEFEEYARVQLHEFDASLADRILIDLETVLIDALIANEAAELKVEPGTIFAREVTNKARDYTPEESIALEGALVNRLKAKYEAKILYAPPEPLVQDISIDDDPSQGPRDAPVVIVMFSDFQCSACKAAHPILKKMLAEFPDKIRFVVRDFPLENLHENAFSAARAANAAHAQGKFFDYIELLYANQDSLSADALTAFAVRVGLNQKKFELDSKTPKLADEIRKDKSDGITYGIDSTPSIFINGVKVRNNSEKAIRSAISSALSK